MTKIDHNLVFQENTDFWPKMLNIDCRLVKYYFSWTRAFAYLSSSTLKHCVAFYASFIHYPFIQFGIFIHLSTYHHRHSNIAFYASFTQQHLPWFSLKYYTLAGFEPTISRSRGGYDIIVPRHQGQDNFCNKRDNFGAGCSVRIDRQ
jgi:hypothetical protein